MNIEQNDPVRALVDFMGGNATVTGGRVYFPERKLRELLRSAQDALAQQPAACDMGALCIGCEPRNADGSCPGEHSAPTDELEAALGQEKENENE